MFAHDAERSQVQCDGLCPRLLDRLLHLPCGLFNNSSVTAQRLRLTFPPTPLRILSSRPRLPSRRLPPSPLPPAAAGVAAASLSARAGSRSPPTVQVYPNKQRVTQFPTARRELSLPFVSCVWCLCVCWWCCHCLCFCFYRLYRLYCLYCQ